MKWLKKRQSRIFHLLIGLILIGCSWLPVFGDSYEITAFNVDVKVLENNSFQIHQRIQAHFPKEKKCFETRIPYRWTIYKAGADGRAASYDYRGKISNLSVEGASFKTKYEGDDLLLKIGGRESFIGTQNYEIRYTLTMPEDPYALSDGIFLNLIPQNPNASVSVGTFLVEMPKEFPGENVTFIAVNHGNQDFNAVTYSVEENTIAGNLNRGIFPEEALHLQVDLPEGYFVKETTWRFERRLMYGLTLMAAVFSVLIWYRFGKNGKIEKTPEYLPPTAVTPAEVGFILDGSADNKDLFSLLIYWANEGYITIELKNRVDFTLAKQCLLPEKAKAYEKTMFKGLFSWGDQVDLSWLEGNFSDTLKKAKRQLRDYFENNREKRQFTKTSKIAKLMCLLLMCIPFLSIGILGNLLACQPVYLIWGFVVFVTLMFLSFLPVLAPGKLWENSAGKQKLFRLVLPLSLGVLYIVVLTLMTSDWYGTLPFASALGAAATALCLMMTCLIKKRTRRGIQAMKRILGFQEFIKTAKPDKLEAMMAMDSDYFYKVLPYAYVLGLSEEWIKRFEKMAIESPKWYYTDSGNGYFNATFFIHAFHSRAKSMSSKTWKKHIRNF